MITGKPLDGVRYSLLHLGETRLLLAQADIRDIEVADDIDPDEAPPGGVGRIRVGRQTHPVYSLSEEFELMNGIPEQRRMCVLLAYQGGLYGLVCDRVEILETPADFYPLPECMRLESSPVEALTLLPDGIASLVSAHRLATLIAQGVRLADDALPIAEYTTGEAYP
jgi:hypothetical protein